VTDRIFRLKQAAEVIFKFALKADVDYIFLASKRGILMEKRRRQPKVRKKAVIFW